MRREDPGGGKWGGRNRPSPPKSLCGSGDEPEMSLREEMAVRVSAATFFRYGRVCKEGPVFRAQEILWE